MYWSFLFSFLFWFFLEISFTVVLGHELQSCKSLSPLLLRESCPPDGFLASFSFFFLVITYHSMIVLCTTFLISYLLFPGNCFSGLYTHALLHPSSVLCCHMTHCHMTCYCHHTFLSTNKDKPLFSSFDTNGTAAVVDNCANTSICNVCCFCWTYYLMQ